MIDVTSASGNWSSSPEQLLFLRRRAGQIHAGPLLVDRRTAEDREPQQAHRARHQHHADDELPDRPAAADPRDEHADERRPGQL
jgi:hypothetical protein